VATLQLTEAGVVVMKMHTNIKLIKIQLLELDQDIAQVCPWTQELQQKEC
jgi:hypothetical protein